MPMGLHVKVYASCTHTCLNTWEYANMLIFTYASKYILACVHVCLCALCECAGMCTHRYDSLHSLLTDRSRNAICTFLLKWKTILKYLLWKTKSVFDPLRLRKASPPRALAGRFLRIIILLNSHSAALNPFEDRDLRPRGAVSGENEKKKILPQLSDTQSRGFTSCIGLLPSCQGAHSGFH